MHEQLPHFPEIPPGYEIDTLLVSVKSFKGILSNLYSIVHFHPQKTCPLSLLDSVGEVTFKK